MVNRLSDGLRASGVERGQRLVWCGPNSLEVLVTIHAARKLGLVAVPLSYRFNAEEMAYVVDNSDATVVVADAEFAPVVDSARSKMTKVRQFVCFGGDTPAGWDDWDRDVLAGRSDAGAAAGRRLGSRRRDDLHVGHHGEAQGRAAHDRPTARSCSRCSRS